MKKVTMLMPINFNNGQPIPTETRQQLLNEIAEAFGGYTIQQNVTGTYRMSSGDFCTEESTPVVVCVEENKLDDLRDEAGRIAKVLAQECLYFEVSSAEVDFIAPKAAPAIDEFIGHGGPLNFVLAA